MQEEHTPPPLDDLRFSNTTCILQKKKKWFIGVEVEQETSAPRPKKNPGSAADTNLTFDLFLIFLVTYHNHDDRIVSFQVCLQDIVYFLKLPIYSVPKVEWLV